MPIRPTNHAPFSPAENSELLQEYFAHYERVARESPHLLNVKLERAAVAEVLDEVGVLLLERSQQLAHAPGPMREYLEATEPPECLRGRLPTNGESHDSEAAVTMIWANGRFFL